MNIWRIASKELKAFRDVKVLFYLLGTPIILILILGTVLTNAFHGSIAVEDIRVLYQKLDSNAEISEYWEVFIEEAEAAGIQFEPASKDMNHLQEVKNNRYVGYVEISDHQLNYYGNSLSRVESDIVQRMLTAFVNRYQLAMTLAEHSLEMVHVGLSDGGADHVEVVSLIGDRQPSAMDYYAIAMVTLLIMFAALGGAELIEEERRTKTATRLLASPVSKIEIFIGKIVGSVLLSMISTTIVVFLCKYMFGVYWGDHLGLVLLVLLTQIIFAVSLGLGLSYLLKGKAAGFVVMMIIQVAAFIGGSYFPVSETTGWMRMITKFSPLEWTNTALLQIIYGQGGSEVGNAMLLNIGFSVLLLGTAAIIMRKREGL